MNVLKFILWIIFLNKYNHSDYETHSPVDGLARYISLHQVTRRINED